MDNAKKDAQATMQAILNDEHPFLELRLDENERGQETFEILIISGGPNVQVQGVLNADAIPMSVDITYQAGLEDKQVLNINGEQEQALFNYANQVIELEYEYAKNKKLSYTDSTTRGFKF